MFIKFKWGGVLSVFLFLSCAQGVGKLVPKGKDRDKVIAESLNLTDVNLSVKSLVDILFVVDDSGSMEFHQKNLAINVNFFIDHFLQNNSLDFRIAVTTTSGLKDVNYGYGRPTKYQMKSEKITYQGPFNRNTPHLDKELMEAFQVGKEGADKESVFMSSKYILERPKKYPNFYRKDAFLVLVFITDAEEQSDISLDDFRKFLIRLKHDPTKIIPYGVLAEKHSLQEECFQDEGPPLKIKYFIKSFNSGLIYSLCDPHFGQRLADIGRDIISRVTSKILLPSKPLVSTIEVSYGFQILPSDVEKGWFYDPSQNAIFISPHVVLKKESEEDQALLEGVPEGVSGGEIEIKYDLAD